MEQNQESGQDLDGENFWQDSLQEFLARILALKIRLMNSTKEYKSTIKT